MAEKHLKLEIVTPEKIVIQDEAQIVVAPGTYGEFGVLPGHTPFLTTLKVGVVRYKDKSGHEQYIFTNGGFSEALPHKVTILTESAEKREDIDIERAKAAMRRAEDRLAAIQQAETKKEDLNNARVRASLQRALARIRVAGGKSQ
ncbi:MAG: F0F1 ATP synthase subunit epsilon [Pseudomonadota bacterium]